MDNWNKTRLNKGKIEFPRGFLSGFQWDFQQILTVLQWDLQLFFSEFSSLKREEVAVILCARLHEKSMIPGDSHSCEKKIPCFGKISKTQNS